MKEEMRPAGSIFLHDFAEKNGKTIKENNLEIIHRISIGTLVEVKFDSWFGKGACWKVHARLWVVGHSRDCDGTPLYTLRIWEDPQFALQTDQCHGGFSEESLTKIELTEAVTKGDNALEWDEEQ